MGDQDAHHVGTGIFAIHANLSWMYFLMASLAMAIRFSYMRINGVPQSNGGDELPGTSPATAAKGGRAEDAASNAMRQSAAEKLSTLCLCFAIRKRSVLGFVSFQQCIQLFFIHIFGQTLKDEGEF